MKHHLGSVVMDLAFEPVPYRVRAWSDGSLALDTHSAVVVWEPRRIVPVFAVPVTDVIAGVRRTDPQPEPSDLSQVPPMLGPTDFGVHTTPGTVVDVGSLAEAGFQPDDADLVGMVVLDFHAFNEWRVEDEPLVGHPHDPFKRIDVMTSDRHVEVRLGDLVLASSTRALALWETHLPVRWYLPPEDVRMDLLQSSDLQTTCAYKGHASYLSLAGEQDIAWFYPAPLSDAARVADHICFWAERTELYLDGVEVPRPVTPWSTPAEQAGADPDKLEFG